MKSKLSLMGQNVLTICKVELFFLKEGSPVFRKERESFSARAGVKLYPNLTASVSLSQLLRTSDRAM